MNIQIHFCQSPLIPLSVLTHARTGGDPVRHKSHWKGKDLLPFSWANRWIQVSPESPAKFPVCSNWRSLYMKMALWLFDLVTSP